MSILEENKEYFGNRIIEWETKHKNVYVITGIIQGKLNIPDNRIGRVAQIRLEAGEFGSDCVLLRHCDDVLTPHENQSFYLIPDEFKDYLDKCFKDVYLDDSDELTYTIQGEDGHKGFIIESEIKENESTPMRNIKNAIHNTINKILDDDAMTEEYDIPKNG